MEIVVSVPGRLLMQILTQGAGAPPPVMPTLMTQLTQLTGSTRWLIGYISQGKGVAVASRWSRQSAAGCGMAPAGRLE